MLERFSERARRVVVLATVEARRRGHGTHPARARRLRGPGRRLFGRPGDEAVRLIATSPWRVRI